nr:MAG TPA: hypothetical protein [Caudoviricetes sp.]
MLKKYIKIRDKIIFILFIKIFSFYIRVLKFKHSNKLYLLFTNI